MLLTWCSVLKGDTAYTLLTGFLILVGILGFLRAGNVVHEAGIVVECAESDFFEPPNPHRHTGHYSQSARPHDIPMKHAVEAGRVWKSGRQLFPQRRPWKVCLTLE
jgi:hypothetical protein